MDVQLHRNGAYWQARWRDVAGRRRAKSLGPIAEMSKLLATRRCRELGAQMIVTPAMREAVKSPTLGAWRDRYFELRTSLDPRTVELHRRTVAYLIEFAGEGVKLEKFTRAMAADFRLWLEKLKGEDGEPQMGETTICGHIRTCKVFFGLALKQDVILFNPFDRESGTAPEVDRDWAEIDAAATIKILDACPSLAWRCSFAMARWGGLRRGEALRHPWPLVDWERRVLIVAPKERKGKRRVTTKQGPRREVPVRAELYAELRQAFEEATPGSFGPCEGISANNIDRDAREIVKRALGATYSKPFHTLRKCCESEWAMSHSIFDVTYWLGNSPEVAAKNYVRPMPESVARITGVSAPTPATNLAQNST